MSRHAAATQLAAEAGDPHRVEIHPRANRRTVSLAFALAVAAALATADARADGGAVCASGPVGRTRVTLFTSPTPLRVGTVDLSVLVQDAATGESLPDAAVKFRIRGDADATGSMEVDARSGASANRLLQSALLRLASPGEVVIEAFVRARGSEGSVSCAARIEDAAPALLAHWPLVALPPVCVGLFAWHQALVRRQAARRVTLRHGGASPAPGPP
jgi:hypothetical protein